MSADRDVLLVSPTEAGHRASYIALFSTLFPSRRARSLAEILLASNPVLFLMVEDSFGFYAAMAVLRALVGRRTVGLLFRPLPAVAPTSLRLHIKSATLRLFKKVPVIKTISILPFDVDSRITRIADTWIHDPQLWDLSECEKDDFALWRAEGGAYTGLVGAIRREAGERIVVAAIGRQDHDKGFDLFAKLYANSPALRSKALFAYGGKVDPRLEDYAAALEDAGGFAARRFVSDTEVLELYAAADLVWATYARRYDQASGIFGRAIQLGLTPIVRDGSLLHRQCLVQDLPHLSVTDETAADRILSHHRSAAQPTSALSQDWRNHAVARLRNALGLTR